jgi:hypothetical protein
MRKSISIAMILLGIGTFASGLAELTKVSASGADHHTIFAILFAIFACIHGWLNRKAFIRYFESLGWRWGLIGLGIVIIVVVCIV